MLCQNESEKVKGDLRFSAEWTLFAPLEREDGLLPEDVLRSTPAEISVSGKIIKAVKIGSFRNQFDFTSHIGEPFNDEFFKKTGYFFILVNAEKEGVATIGIGGDNWVQAWLNGEPLFEGKELEAKSFPPKIIDNITGACFKKGENVLVIRLVCGKGVSVLAAGGPCEIRKGDFRSIIEEPLTHDPRWASPLLCTGPKGKAAVDIGSRLELFIDDFMLDDISAGAERRLHHPIPREIVFESNKPWDGATSGYHSVIETDGKIRMYFSGRPHHERKLYAGKNVNTDYVKEQTICLIESKDGINFIRPNLGLIEFDGSNENNIVYYGTPAHNLTPFLDTNPKAIPGQRFKAIGYAEEESHGLAAYSSADGINWGALSNGSILSVEKCSSVYGANRLNLSDSGRGGNSGFDSQNVAFWDENIGKYACYYRSNYGGFRRIFRAVSENFMEWSDFRELEYNDGLNYQYYTNCIRPYARAPHIYIGTPARFVAERMKKKDHITWSISDAILMSSRDGVKFERWEEGFIRPCNDIECWTDRNNYPAWGMVQTSPEEISIYWTEHHRFETNRLRRGTLRTDGFVSVHAGTRAVGEILTRPFKFSGKRMIVNYATSAIGAIRFEICDGSGNAVDGYRFADSEVLYGNEIGHTVLWNECEDVLKFAGKDIRLRVRLHDADFYSFRFAG